MGVGYKIDLRRRWLWWRWCQNDLLNRWKAFAQNDGFRFLPDGIRVQGRLCFKDGWRRPFWYRVHPSFRIWKSLHFCLFQNDTARGFRGRRNISLVDPRVIGVVNIDAFIGIACICLRAKPVSICVFKSRCRCGYSPFCLIDQPGFGFHLIEWPPITLWSLSVDGSRFGTRRNRCARG